MCKKELPTKTPDARFLVSPILIAISLLLLLSSLHDSTRLLRSPATPMSPHLVPALCCITHWVLSLPLRFQSSAATDIIIRYSTMMPRVIGQSWTPSTSYTHGRPKLHQGHISDVRTHNPFRSDRSTIRPRNWANGKEMGQIVVVVLCIV